MAIKVTYYGHACIGMEIAGQHLLVDPFISPNEAAKGIDLDKIPADWVLLTHGHEDHVADAESILKRTGATLVANFEVANWFQSKGVEMVRPLNHGGSISTPWGKIKFVNAVHSSVLPDGSYGGNPGGFVIESEEGNAYLSGDTALHYDMKLLGEFHQLDWAALCIGDCFTMGPEDAAIAAEWAGVKQVLGLHYDTFPPIEIDHMAAKAAFTSRGITLRLPEIGDSVNFT